MPSIQDFSPFTLCAACKLLFTAPDDPESGVVEGPGRSDESDEFKLFPYTLENPGEDESSTVEDESNKNEGSRKDDDSGKDRHWIKFLAPTTSPEI